MNCVVSASPRQDLKALLPFLSFRVFVLCFAFLFHGFVFVVFCFLVFFFLVLVLVPCLLSLLILSKHTSCIIKWFTHTLNIHKQGDSKRWTQLNSKRRLNTRQTVGCGIPSSLLALRVDLRGLRSKLSWILLTFSSDTPGRPELLPLHRQPTCSNWWLQRQMLFLVGGWMLKRRLNASCTAVADSVLMNSRTQKLLCCIVAILLSTDAAARLCDRRGL